jgi:UDP-2-acetamido-3-amino-2,3-dideoxy-glucuronate N-acetyltransferase
MELAEKNGYFFHPTCLIDEPCKIGEGTKIWCFSHIMKGAKIGKNCKIGQNVVIHGTAVIGNNVKIQNNVSVYDAVILEDNVFCGPSMVFNNIINPRSEYPRNDQTYYKKTHVKEGATIGANATIVCGNTIGRYAFIGAAGVVTHDIPDYALAYGNPARIKGWMCECGYKLSFVKGNAVCKGCKKEFKQSKNIVRSTTKTQNDIAR